MSLHDVSYQHWEGRHYGIWRRRWVIASNGLKAWLDNKWVRNLVLLTWTLVLVAVAVLFLIGQLLVEDSMLYKLVDQFGDQVRGFVEGLVDWLTKHPEISVRVTHNLFFYFFASQLRLFAMIAVALVIPHLIARDLSSRAIIIYSSKAINRFDYFLGKFGTVFGLLTLMWLGPVLAAWVAGNLLAPDWGFFWHSRGALFNSLLYMLSAMFALSIVGLGVSALSPKPRLAMSYWIIFWLIGNAISAIGVYTKAWLRHFSISYNLDQISRQIFDLKGEIDLAVNNVPYFGEFLENITRDTVSSWLPDIDGAWIALAAMLLGAVLIMLSRVKPE